MPKEQNVTLDQVVEVIGGEVRKAVDKCFDFLQKTVSSYPLGDTELDGKAKDCAEKNITIARDYMHKLTRAKNFLEAVPIHTEFMQSALTNLTSRACARARARRQARQGSADHVRLLTVPNKHNRRSDAFGLLPDRGSRKDQQT